MKNIFEKYTCPTVGMLKNRIVMSPMTRGFADKDHCCTDLMCNYYARRAKNGVGLILTEGIVINKSGDGYNNVPHIETNKQADSWKETIRSVHKYSSKIVAQLWHCGRISHPDYLDGNAPVSSTDKPADGINRQNNKSYGRPEALTIDGIDKIIDMYVESTNKALKIGFDAVQIHMGHGYLIDQFFDDRVNDRTDAYGGSVENRCRFAIDLISELVNIFGSEKIMIRISPSRYMGEIYEWRDLDKMLEHLIYHFNRVGLKVIDISCANSIYHKTSGLVARKIRDLGWNGVILGGASLSVDEANYEINHSILNLVTWGRYILANPDFVQKVANNENLINMSDENRNSLY